MNSKKSYTFIRPEHFDLNMIFDCGQCFRFDRTNGVENAYEGVALGKYLKIVQNDKNITVFGIDKDDYEQTWKHFFAVDEDYENIQKNILSSFGNDDTILSAIKSGDGIRILHQDPWEVICSFIISQNNNIPRIKKIISAISQAYGEKIISENGCHYAFPTATALFNAGEEKIFSLKTGFRAGYIYDAAKKVSRGELNLELMSSFDTDKLIKELMSVKGIGPKVASCIALFGFGKTDAFPIDVWMKKVIAKYYPQGLSPSTLGGYAGIAQQYLFHYERYLVAKAEA